MAFASGLVPAGKEKVKALLDRAETSPDIMILQFLLHAFGRANSILNVFSDFWGVFQKI